MRRVLPDAVEGTCLAGCPSHIKDRGQPCTAGSLQGPCFDEGGGGPKREDKRMLRVPTYVAPSSIAGMGLFAATNLPAGCVIWEFTEGVDWRIDPTELSLFPEPFQTRMRHYLYQEDSGVYVLCGDNGKYMNHSDDPNCDDPEGEHTVTNRAVRAGQELTCDYRSFDLEAKTIGLFFGAATEESNRSAPTV